jgi:hypothetical protein
VLSSRTPVAASFPSPAADRSGWIAQQITNQGLIISANEIFWISAAIFILLLGLVT